MTPLAVAELNSAKQILWRLLVQAHSIEAALANLLSLILKKTM